VTQRTDQCRAALRAVAFSAVVTLLSGCGLNSITSGLGGGLFASDETKAPVEGVTEGQLLSAAQTGGSNIAVGSTVAHGCPRFLVWSPGNHTTTYLPGRDGDAMAVMHRGEITKTARECTIEPGLVTVKYGFSGRVLLGPSGQSARVNLPIKVFVTDADRQRLSSENIDIAVDVAVDNPIAYFSHVQSVSFAIPQGTRPGEFEVYVGFDEQNAQVGRPAPGRS
jgi:hypothetical protein